MKPPSGPCDNCRGGIPDHLLNFDPIKKLILNSAERRKHDMKTGSDQTWISVQVGRVCHDTRLQSASLVLNCSCHLVTNRVANKRRELSSSRWFICCGQKTATCDLGLLLGGHEDTGLTHFSTPPAHLAPESRALICARAVHKRQISSGIMSYTSPQRKVHGKTWQETRLRKTFTTQFKETIHVRPLVD